MHSFSTTVSWMWVCNKDSRANAKERQTSDCTLAGWAEILSMENPGNCWSSESMTLSVLCTLNNVGSSLTFLSTCAHTCWSHRHNVPGAGGWCCACSRADSVTRMWANLGEPEVPQDFYSIKWRIPSWGLFLHYCMPIDRHINQLNIEKLLPRTGYKTTLISKALLFLWTHCYVAKLLNNTVLISDCFQEKTSSPVFVCHWRSREKYHHSKCSSLSISFSVVVAERKCKGYLEVDYITQPLPSTNLKSLNCCVQAKRQMRWKIQRTKGGWGRLLSYRAMELYI